MQNITRYINSFHDREKHDSGHMGLSVSRTKSAGWSNLQNSLPGQVSTQWAIRSRTWPYVWMGKIHILYRFSSLEKNDAYLSFLWLNYPFYWQLWPLIKSCRSPELLREWRIKTPQKLPCDMSVKEVTSVMVTTAKCCVILSYCWCLMARALYVKEEQMEELVHESLVQTKHSPLPLLLV